MWREVKKGNLIPRDHGGVPVFHIDDLLAYSSSRPWGKPRREAPKLSKFEEARQRGARPRVFEN